MAGEAGASAARGVGRRTVRLPAWGDSLLNGEQSSRLSTLLLIALMGHGLRKAMSASDRSVTQRIATLVPISKGPIFAGLLLPAGFFLGGLVLHEGGSGLAILLVSAGGIVLVATVALLAWRVGRGGRGS